MAQRRLSDGLTRGGETLELSCKSNSKGTRMERFPFALNAHSWPLASKHASRMGLGNSSIAPKISDRGTLGPGHLYCSSATGCALCC